MDVREALNSGLIHKRAIEHRGVECVDKNGNVHTTAKRARFMDWVIDKMDELDGAQPSTWSEADKAEYKRRYVPSH